MNEILFLVFAFLTVFLSIKLSYYADRISKTSLVSGALIGGIVLAGVTSLPEFVTCFSAIMVGNPTLAIGDVLGSNLFNIFMICFFDIVFIRKMIFSCTSKSHNLVLLILLVNYLVLYLFISKIFDFSLFSIGIPSIVIIITYIIYIKSISKFCDNEVVINDSGDSHLILKLVVTAIFMVMSSVILTIIVNNLSIIYPSFSSSFLGAIFLGITTSLPEVITFYTLVTIGSYDLALSNIVGSNLFNLLVLAVGDILVFGYSIYDFSDRDTILIVILGFVFTLVCLFSNNRKSVRNSLSYILLSLLVIVLYLSFWITNFIKT
ncbi:MAG: sodium:calcium antiporter [Bacilli bacterium]